MNIAETFVAVCCMTLSFFYVCTTAAII